MDGTRSRLDHRTAGSTQRAILGRVGYDFESFERDAGDTEVDRSAAAIDDGSGSDHARAGFLQDVDHFARAAAGSDDIFDDDGGFAGLDGESAAQDHFAGAIAFGENVAGSERSRYFVTDDQAADCGRDDGGNVQRGLDAAELGGEQATELLGMIRKLENARALQIFGAMQSASEAEMSTQVCAGVVEGVQDGIGLRSHKHMLAAGAERMTDEASFREYKDLHALKVFTNLYRRKVMSR